MLKSVKITQTLWLNVIADKIDAFARKMKVPSIFPQTLATYFHSTIQYGGDKAEFWVVFEDEQPVAFAHFFVRGLPHIGVVYCDFIHSWTNDREAVMMLLREIDKFATKNRATLLEGDVLNQRLYTHFERVGASIGWKPTKNNIINFMAKRIPQEKKDV